MSLVCVVRDERDYGKWYGVVWSGVVWYCTVWYGGVWYGMVWYGVPGVVWLTVVPVYAVLPPGKSIRYVIDCAAGGGAVSGVSRASFYFR